jgi:hypothetical protein
MAKKTLKPLNATYIHILILLLYSSVLCPKGSKTYMDKRFSSETDLWADGRADTAPIG